MLLHLGLREKSYSPIKIISQGLGNTILSIQVHFCTVIQNQYSVKVTGPNLITLWLRDVFFLLFQPELIRRLIILNPTLKKAFRYLSGQSQDKCYRKSWTFQDQAHSNFFIIFSHMDEIDKLKFKSSSFSVPKSPRLKMEN